MKWYNKDLTACLDLDKIALWVFKDKDDMIQLDVYISSGSPFSYYGAEAQQIYKMLTSNKEVI